MALPPDVIARARGWMQSQRSQQAHADWTRATQDPDLDSALAEAFRRMARDSGETPEQVRHRIGLELQSMARGGQSPPGRPMPHRGPPNMSFAGPQRNMPPRGMYERDPYDDYDGFEGPMGDGSPYGPRRGPPPGARHPQEQFQYGPPSRDPYNMPPGYGSRGPPQNAYREMPNYAQSARERYDAPPWARDPSPPRRRRSPAPGRGPPLPRHGYGSSVMPDYDEFY